MIHHKFLSTLSLRRATEAGSGKTYEYVISIHALLAESDYLDAGKSCNVRRISIHALLAESDPNIIGYSINFHPISIHALLAESDHKSGCIIQHNNISIHALLAESDICILGKAFFTAEISIHALLAESDCRPMILREFLFISIHALLAESDDDLEPSTTRRLTFLSTLSLRRATERWQKLYLFIIFLSTLSLRRATHVAKFKNWIRYISIHALLAESDSQQNRFS